MNEASNPYQKYQDCRPWTPKRGDEAFINTDHKNNMEVWKFNRMDGEHEMYIRMGEMETMFYSSERKPFNPAYIGKPWSEIPEGR